MRCMQVVYYTSTLKEKKKKPAMQTQFLQSGFFSAFLMCLNCIELGGSLLNVRIRDWCGPINFHRTACVDVDHRSFYRSVARSLIRVKF